MLGFRARFLTADRTSLHPYLSQFIPMRGRWSAKPPYGALAFHEAPLSVGGEVTSMSSRLFVQVDANNSFRVADQPLPIQHVSWCSIFLVLASCDDWCRPRAPEPVLRYREAGVWRNMPREVRIHVDVDGTGHYTFRVRSGRREITTTVNPGWVNFADRYRVHTTGARS